MKQKLLVFAFTIFSIMLRAQSGTPYMPMAFTEWETNQGTQHLYQKNVTKTDGSGNVYTAGASLNVNGKYDGFLSKVSSGGTVIYTVQINGTANDHDFIAGMVISGTDVFVTGTITNSVTMIPELFIAKYNSSGVQQFFTTYSNGYGDLGKDVAINSTYNYIIVTGASYNSSFSSNMSIIAFNSSGVQQWANLYDHAGLNDGGFKVTTRSGSCTMTGPVTISANNYKLASISYSVPTGVQTGSVVTGATATSSVEIVSDLVSDGAGNMYLCGATQQNVGQGYDMYIAKVTNTLGIVWEQTINGFSGSSLDDFARGIQIDGSSNVYVTGVTTHSTQGKNLTTVKLNSSGVVQWTKNINGAFNGNDCANDLAIDASADVYITGYQTIGTNNTDIYSAKLDNSTGNIIWEKYEESDLNDEGTNLVLDNSDVVVAGSHEVTTGNYEYVTYKYVQKDVITPTDFNGETPNSKFMYFQNRGQIIDTSFTSVSDVKFYTHCTFPSFYFKEHSQSFVFSHIDTLATTNDTLHRVDLTFNNVNESSKTYPMEQQDNGYLNYFMGYLPEQITNVKGNKYLITTSLYNNIDLMCSSNQNGIKYYFIVKPGADMRDIQMEFTGATSYSLNGTTNALSINSSMGSITFDKPVAYQLTAANATVAVTSFSPTWTTNGASNKYKFNNGTYTASLTLVIEVDQGNSAVASVTTAPNIEWSTNFGSSDFETTSGTKYGSANNLFLIGCNSTAPLPQAPGVTALTTYQFANKGLLDGYIAKFDQTGILKWRTYVGGSGHDQIKGFDLASNGTGDLYCVGITQSATLAVVAKAGTSVNHATHASAGANKDGFIFQLNQNGKTCSWLTYYGGNSEDFLNDCKFDGLGNLFIVGYSASSSLTVTGSAPQYTCSYIDVNSNYDAYIMKLNNSSFNIDWATYVASNSTVTCSVDRFFVLDFDSNNNVFVGGDSNGNNYPVLYSSGSSTMASTNNCLADGIITQFDNSGQMLWSTYIGGQGTDGIQAIKLDGRDLYIGGYTNGTTSFPTYFSGSLYANTTKTVTPTSSMQESGFFAYINYLNHREHITLIGGDDGNDQVTGIAIDAVHNIYLVGMTSSTSLDQPSGGNPSNTWSENNKGYQDEFVFVVQKGTTYPIWSTEVGGDGDEYTAVCATIDGNNNLFLSSSTRSMLNFPWNDGGGVPVHFQGNLTGGQTDIDGCITRFKLSNINFVGIQEFNTISEGILLYPNPSQNSLTIQLSNIDDKKNFTIFNTMGQIISTGSLQTTLTTINIANLAEGMYIIEIADKKTKVTAKFIKQ